MNEPKVIIRLCVAAFIELHCSFLPDHAEMSQSFSRIDLVDYLKELLVIPKYLIIPDS